MIAIPSGMYQSMLQNARVCFRAHYSPSLLLPVLPCLIIIALWALLAGGTRSPTSALSKNVLITRNCSSVKMLEPACLFFSVLI